MEETSLLNTSDAAPLSEIQRPIWRDILAQAITGEIIGSLNYATLADLYAGEDDRKDALEHSDDERAHATRFSAIARELNLDVSADPTAPYWKRVRSAFLSRAAAGDLIACIIAQEVMLESFAVATYELIGRVAPGRLGSVFCITAREEGEHVGHAIVMLQAERGRSLEAFDQKAQEVHQEVMTVLAEMVAREDHSGHCGLCSGTCVKASLPKIGLSTASLRGVSLQLYLKTLDAIGVPGKSSLTWVAKLPV